MLKRFGKFQEEVRQLRSHILANHGEKCKHQIAGHCYEMKWLIACDNLQRMDVGDTVSWLAMNWRTVSPVDCPTIQLCIDAFDWQQRLIGGASQTNCPASRYVEYILKE